MATTRMTVSAAASFMASRTTRPTTSMRVAPSATRIAISRTAR
jgi:hypothetical protein